MNNEIKGVKVGNFSSKDIESVKNTISGLNKKNEYNEYYNNFWRNDFEGNLHEGEQREEDMPKVKVRSRTNKRLGYINFYLIFIATEFLGLLCILLAATLLGFKS